MPQKKNATLVRNPSNNHPPKTPRRSPRFLQYNHNPTAILPTPYPSNSKLKDSTKKPSNRKKSTESHSSNSRTCAVALRRSPRFANLEEKVPVTHQNDEKPSRNDTPSGGSRRPAKSKCRGGDGAVEEAKAKAEEKPVEHCAVASEEAAVEGKKRNGERNEGGEKGKRKRKRRGGGKETAEGWTKEQELALQRAFFSAKPSPHFWKNVSKLVPGKSQQDCFDRIHGDHITPPQLQPRSRAKTIKSSPIQQFSISASKLLKPIDNKVKRSNFLKPKNYITKKSIEKLLHRSLQVDQDREGDIFAVLEPNIDFSTNAFKPSAALSTPKQLKENRGLLQSCTETSSSSHKKSVSRFSGSCLTNLISPPVLKQVKNKGMHEKYINQLRCREAKRRAGSARIQMPITGEGNSIQKGDVVKAAKVALVSEARDAISKFQQSQVNFMDNTFCSDEDNSNDIGVEYESQ